jgi:hypothetical protein
LDNIISVAPYKKVLIDDFGNGKTTPTIIDSSLVVSGSYIATLPLPTSKQLTMVGVAFSISEVVYYYTFPIQLEPFAMVP